MYNHVLGRGAWLLYLSLLTTSACIVGSGVEATETVELGMFSGVSQEAFLDVTVSQGEPGSVTYTCDDNIMDDLVIEVVAEMLVIRTPSNKSYNPKVDCRAEVTAPACTILRTSGSGGITTTDAVEGLEEVEATGSGDIEVPGVTSDTLRVSCSGSGDLRLRSLQVPEVQVDASASGRVELEGDTTDLSLRADGSGHIRARELISARAVVRSSGSGDVEVQATDRIEIRLSGSGDVDVWGDPEQRDENDSGSGRITFH
jgi:hypothetical protein